MGNAETPGVSGLMVSLVGVLSLSLYGWLALGLEATSDRTAVLVYLGTMMLLFVGYGLVAARYWRRSESVLPSVRRVLMWAILFRVVMLAAGLDYDRPVQGLVRDLSGGETGYETFLLYDNDIWRYLWDGHLVARGESPYATTPFELEEAYLESERVPEALAASFEDERWLEVYDNLSFTAYATVYGPLAQQLFGLVSGPGKGSVLVLKSVLVVFDLGTCWLLVLLGRRLDRPEAVLVYAWNPMVIKEIAGSGHVDSVMVFLVVAAFVLWLDRKPLRSMVLLAAGALIKFVPLVLFPFFLIDAARRTAGAGEDRAYRMRALLASATAGVLFLLAWLPVRADLWIWSQAVRSFLGDWAFNPGPYRLIVEALSALGLDGWALAVWPGRAILALVLLSLGYALWRGVEKSVIVFAVLASVVWLGATVNPWYLIWALPFAALIGCWPWWVLTGLSQLSYVFYLDQVERPWLMWIEHGLFALLLIVWFRTVQLEETGWTRPGRTES